MLILSVGYRNSHCIILNIFRCLKYFSHARNVLIYRAQGFYHVIRKLATGSSPTPLIRMQAGDPFLALFRPVKPSFAMDGFYFGTADRRGGFPNVSKLSSGHRSSSLSFVKI